MFSTFRHPRHHQDNREDRYGLDDVEARAQRHVPDTPRHPTPRPLGFSGDSAERRLSLPTGWIWAPHRVQNCQSGCNRCPQVPQNSGGRWEVCADGSSEEYIGRIYYSVPHRAGSKREGSRVIDARQPRLSTRRYTARPSPRAPTRSNVQGEASSPTRSLPN